MFTLNYYLDSRKTKPGNPAPLKLVITKKNERASISLGIKLNTSEWNAKKQKCSTPAINESLQQRMLAIHTFLLKKESEKELKNLSARKIRDLIVSEFIEDPESDSDDRNSESVFLMRFQKFRDAHTGRTWEIYNHTLSRITAFIGEKALSKLNFEDINIRWLKDFDIFLSKTSPSRNARNIHFRNIRAVFNDAIDDELISCYPFRKFKLKGEETEKRSLYVEDLRKIFNCEVEPYAEIYRDMFKLIFMLIGINTVDLYRLKEVTSEGRIEYKRAKTHKAYSIKVEPEAMEIIKKYTGKSGLLKIADRWIDHAQFRKQLNKALGLIGAPRTGLGGKKGKGWFPKLTSYWARHTWATIAAEIDVPDAVISQALGHAPENMITEIYIRRNNRKVDEANRKVLDWVLYGKI